MNPSSSVICCRALISGRVQGVCYRLYTQQKAQELGLMGWVQNLADGRVEAIIQGDRKLVEEMLAWLWEGSPNACVQTVETDNQTISTFRTFEIRR